MSIRSLFSEADLEQVREAIARVESCHAGEIVPYLVGRVDTHSDARWRGATLGGVLAVLLSALIYQHGGFWWAGGPFWIMLPAIGGAALGYLLALVPMVGRNLLSQHDINRRVQLRAEAAFLEEGVCRTRDRTGILVFLAIYEHRALILADEGINQAVPAGVWQELVDDLVAGIKDKRAVESLCEIIGRCGQVLQQYQVTKMPEDENELQNGLRIREN